MITAMPDHMHELDQYSDHRNVLKGKRYEEVKIVRSKLGHLEGGILCL
jgi:hypothetical protein